MGAWSVVARGDVSAAQWDDVVAASDEGWLWHRHGFQDLLTTWPRRGDRSFALKGASGEVAAVVPVHLVESKAGPLTIRRLDSFGGPCLADLPEPERRSANDAIRSALVAAARQHRAIVVSATLPAVAPAWRAGGGVRVNPLLLLGMADRSSTTWVVDLQRDEETLWTAVQKRTREHIRAASRRGIDVRQGGPEDLPAYYRLHVTTCARTGATPHPLAYFAGIFGELLTGGLARSFLAEKDGEVLAGLNLAVDKRAAVYWTAASTEEGRAAHANDLLAWEAIRTMRSEGTILMEFGDAHLSAASTRKHRQISSFKRKFGGSLEPIFSGRMEAGGRAARVAMRLVEARPFASD